jgi:hypothetical protein
VAWCLSLGGARFDFLDVNVGRVDQ